MGKFTFGQTGVSYECDKVELKVNEGAPRCQRCHQTVYFNEEKKAIGRSWHARCFTCCECKKTLSGTNYNEYNGEILCTTCHRRHSTHGAVTLNNSSAPAAAAAAAAGDDDDEDAGDSTPTPQSHADEAESSQREVPLRHQLVNKHDAECCPQCGRTVYFAEEIKALKRKWHRLCFKCVSCKRTLEPGKCTEHEGQLFCHQCHRQQFGPHALRTTTSPASSSSSSLTSSFATDASHRVGHGAVAYVDAFETGDDDRSVHVEPTQPIRGTQEWTESFVYDQTSSDYQQYKLQ